MPFMLRYDIPLVLAAISSLVKPSHSGGTFSVISKHIGQFVLLYPGGITL